jgi:U3 small nucleolar RNA-associated protein 5
MVLSQVELRASATPASLTSSVGRTEQTKKDRGALKRYIEDDTDSDDGVKIDVGVEVDSDDEGSIEDIELGGESENDDEEGEDLSDSDGGNFTDFIDDEAVDDFSEEDTDDESE